MRGSWHQPAEGDAVIAYKLLRLRKDGSLGPLFINRSQRLEVGVEYSFEDHPTKGYAHRPGWHACAKPVAPHLSKRGRVWAKVRLKRYTGHPRPEHQGGIWYLAESMKILKILE
jgi:hypothetical protein